MKHKAVKITTHNNTVYVYICLSLQIFLDKPIKCVQFQSLGTQLPLNLTATDRDTAIGDSLHFYVLPSENANLFTTYIDNNHLYVASEITVPSGNLSLS